MKTISQARTFRSALCFLLSLLAVSVTTAEESERKTSKPNIVIILTDDLGYGDVSFLNAESKVKTPHMDALAETGVWATDAHSPSTVCSPSRYAMLTGRYAWRQQARARGASEPMERIGHLGGPRHPPQNAQDQGLCHRMYWQVAPRV